MAKDTVVGVVTAAMLGLAALSFGATGAIAQGRTAYVCDGGLEFTADFDGNRAVLEFPGGHRVVLDPAVTGSGMRYVGGGYELAGKADFAFLTRPGDAPVNCSVDAAVAAGPSFNCSGRLGAAEQRICANPALGELDRRMADAFAFRLDSLAGRERDLLLADQRQWLGERNRCGFDDRCIEGAYYDRIAALEEWEEEPPGGGFGGTAFPRPARSWGGIVRSGPGTHFARIGSLPEGAPITLLADAGVIFDGYTWFEIEFSGRRGFQWGGIVCAIGSEVPGAFEVCN